MASSEGGSDPAAILAAARAHQQAGRLLEAERLCRAACAHDPQQPEALHLLGIVAHQLGKSAAAADALTRAAALRPDAPALHNDLGTVLAIQGRFDAAAAAFARAAALAPADAQAQVNLGNALARLGRLAQADEAFTRALAVAPDFAPAHLARGAMLQAQGQAAAAVAAFRQAVAAAPEFAMAHFNLGLALRAAGDPAAAVPHLERAAALAPRFAEAHNALAAALQESGAPDTALAHLRTALALQPRSAGAHNNIANALRERGALEEAVAHYERALALQPQFPAALYNLGVALRGLGRIEDAAAAFARALAIAPDFLPARFAFCMAQLPIVYDDAAQVDRCRAAYEEALAALCRAVEAERAPERLCDVLGAHQPFYLPYQGADDRVLQGRYGALACRIAGARFPAAPPRPPASPGEPVRVAIVSGFFRQHSNWKIPIKGWLGELDRRRFQIFGYHTGADADAVTDTAAAQCTRFLRGPRPLPAWRTAILDDAPHVILYPEIGMDGVAAQLAAQRLAPVQCASWGHPETTGFPTIDYFLSSALMEPPGADAHYTERLVRLPNLSIYYEPPDVIPAPARREDLGLRPEAVVFWSGQSLPKYRPAADALLAQIARAAPDCQFVFIRFPGAAAVNARFEARLQRAFADCGLQAADHCVFLPRLDPHAFLAAVGACDAVLDTVGWSGCNSLLESLAYDLPAVTLPGPLMRGRHAAAILTRMDVTDTIATDRDAYVRMAVRLAQDAHWRRDLKTKIAARKDRLYRDRACIEALETFLEDCARGGGPA